MAIPQGRNQRRSLDFLSDAFADGRRFRILAVVEDLTRECPAMVADTSLPAPAAWKDDCNTIGPHSALGNLSPAEYAGHRVREPQRDGTLRYTEGSAPSCSTEPHGLN